MGNRKQREQNKRTAADLQTQIMNRLYPSCVNCRKPGNHWLPPGGMMGYEWEGFWTCNPQDVAVVRNSPSIIPA